MYNTTELEIASFLKARGHKLLGAARQGYLVEFHFPDEAGEDVPRYIAGAEMPARDLFEAHRSLRALIAQVKQHNGAQRSYGHERTYR
jgi:hypothetical protein